MSFVLTFPIPEIETVEAFEVLQLSLYWLPLTVIVKESHLGAGGALVRVLQVSRPPGPKTAMIYVLDPEPTLTLPELTGETEPTPWLIVAEVAFELFHVSLKPPDRTLYEILQLGLAGYLHDPSSTVALGL